MNPAVEYLERDLDETTRISGCRRPMGDGRDGLDRYWTLGANSRPNSLPMFQIKDDHKSADRCLCIGQPCSVTATWRINEHAHTQ